MMCGCSFDFVDPGGLTEVRAYALAILAWLRYNSIRFKYSSYISIGYLLFIAVREFCTSQIVWQDRDSGISWGL